MEDVCSQIKESTMSESLDPEILTQVIFTSNLVDCDGSAATDKRNNRRRQLKRNSRKSRNTGGVRSKFLLEGIRQELFHLQRENDTLRNIVIARIEPASLAEDILRTCESPPVDVFLRSTMLMEEEETKTGVEYSMGDTKEDNVLLQKPKSFIKIGQEIDILQSSVPVKELLVPFSNDDRINCGYKEPVPLLDSDKDNCQVLVDAFTSECAF